MGLPDTSPVPKKDPMGMDYIPVYEGEDRASNAGEIQLSTAKVQRIGVRTERARRAPLQRSVRAAGRIEADERRIATITAKFDGYIERLLVDATGQGLRRGQPLFEFYSPELVSAQREYLIATQGIAQLNAAAESAQDGMRQLAASSLARLRNWDIADEQLRALAQTGTVQRTWPLRSPAAGIVTEKRAVQGMRFMPGEVLYRVADLSSVWMLAEVFERDAGLVSAGLPATVTIDAYPGRVFSGAITYVYPTLTRETRTVPVRIELANPDGLLKPGMFAAVELAIAAGAAVVTVPASAVIDSGVRRVVLVDLGEGRFTPRAVKLGASDGERVEILEGVGDGEPVVVAANFLIDAESNLQAALAGFGDAVASPAPVAHRALGRVDAVDADVGTAMVTHEPVTSLNWPAMTMQFVAANETVLAALRPGAPIDFEFVERGPGEWVITAVTPAATDRARNEP
ncbi:MAG: efflux RND transporter periplasmic adaptor subunit [Gammaproteobacteria bacterium]|nr:efflux RND transporter periplasmic adaptor subunit [Gammaproteobacteria bacterium]